MGDSWRTLTSAEWVYLLNTRTVTVGGAQQTSYGEGTVNGVQGLIILPDIWDGPECSSFTYGISSFSNTFDESSTTKWSQMESAGVVFLPCSDYRNGVTVLVGSYGNYWSSSAGSGLGAYSLLFGSGVVNPACNANRCYGRSVRLVLVLP